MSSDQQPLHQESVESRDAHQDDLPKQKTCNSFCVYKFLVLLYALLFFIVGLILLGIGLWVVSVKQDYDSVTDILTSPAVLSLLVGLVVMFTALCGFVGALRESLIPLRIFLAIVIIVFILQVVIGIIAFIYREEAVRMGSEKMEGAIREYTHHDSVRKAVDEIQSTFECCGIKNPIDWNLNDDYSCMKKDARYRCSVPASCCRDQIQSGPLCGRGMRANETIELEDYIWMEGCNEQFLKWIENNLDIVGATALGFAILHLLGIFLVYLFITKVENRRVMFKFRKRIYDQD